MQYHDVKQDYREYTRKRNNHLPEWRVTIHKWQSCLKVFVNLTFEFIHWKVDLRPGVIGIVELANGECIDHKLVGGTS